MKNIIKLLSVILVFTMLATIFASCSDVPEDGVTSDSTPSNADTPDDPGEPEEPAEPDDGAIKIANIEQFKLLIESINANPESTKGKIYRLYTDITYVVGWDASPASAYGKLVAPGEIEEFPGIKEFYGTFDGNGKTISAIYRIGADDATVLGGFIDKLNGGTVKNLVFNSSYISDDNGAAISGLVGTVNGANASIENVTVNSNVYAVNDSAVTVGGVVGTVEADGFTMTKVKFGGKAGNIAADLTIPSASTEAKLAQLIGDAGDKAVTLTECTAGGDLICADGATKETYANGSAVTVNNCTTTPCENPGVVEISEYKIYNASELLSIAAYNSTFEGRTVKLMRDIDFNPEWTADATAPAVVWTGITDFKGTFDGNGRIIKGLYRSATDTASVGFIDTLNGGTVKNLILFNSAVVYSSDTTAASVGLIGTANGGVVDTVYSELDVYVTGTAAASVGGMIGTTAGAAAIKNIVFAGDITANGKISDQIIAVQSAQSVVEDVLAIGTSSISTDGRTRILTSKISDVPEGYGWEMSSYIEAIMPASAAQMMKALTPLVPDTTWYNETDKEFTLTTPEQLLGLSQLGQSNDFEGVTIKLGADIDLNRGWDATTTVASNGVVTLADAPLNAWTSIPLFKGTIDGQEHTISGIYSYTDFTVPSSDATNQYTGGFINVLQNGEIKNLIVKNSLAHFTSTTGQGGSARMSFGGFIASVKDSTLDTLYVDIDTWIQFSYHYTMGGMICEIDTLSEDYNYVGSIKNIVYAGMTGRISSDGTYNKAEEVKKDERIYIAGMIGQSHEAIDNGSSKSNGPTKITMENLSFIGICYRPANSINQVTGDPLLGYTGGGNYNAGIAVNNTSIYSDEIAFGKTVGAFNTASSTTLTSTATDIDQNAGSVVTKNDTYEATGWKTMVIENGAKVTDPILLPGSVVDMLTKPNA